MIRMKVNIERSMNEEREKKRRIKSKEREKKVQYKK